MSKKNRRKMRKALATMLAALLLVVVSVGATIAYLTDEEDVVNTFTVGNVQISLDEAKVEYNKESNKYVAKGEEREKDQQKYKLLPGIEIVKDPTVTVDANSEESYIRAFVTVSNIEKVDALFAKYAWDIDKIVKNVSEDWTVVGNVKDEAADTRTYEFRYKETVNTLPAEGEEEGDPLKLEALFDTICVPGEIINDDLANLNNTTITVIAQAIQADGFATADLAWAEWKD
ncbi:MAG: hypothetical protein E7337_04920 [Clostridiales bacterium]|nr:hypothetical protein [Clostridiales bacterium]